MIKKEFYMKRADGINLYLTYSDANVYILQLDTGIIYESAVDVENSFHTYEETDEIINFEEKEVNEYGNNNEFIDFEN